MGTFDVLFLGCATLTSATGVFCWVRITNEHRARKHTKAKIERAMQLELRRGEYIVPLCPAKPKQLPDGRWVKVRPDGFVEGPAIPPEIREELDRTPGWWDKQFHKLLSSVETPVVYEEEYVEEITFGGDRILYPTRQVKEYLGCTCTDCKKARRR